MTTEINTVYPSLELAENPYEFFDELHQNGRVNRVPQTGEFLISRYEDILHVLRHPEVFSNAAARQHHAGDNREDHSSMIASDPPVHREKRRLCGGGFRPRRLREFEPTIRELADGLIDKFIDRGEVEFVSEFATPLPILAFCSMFFGDADEDLERFRRWSLREGTGARYLPKERRDAAERMREEMIDYITGEVVDRFHNPRGDGLSEIVQAQVKKDGSPNIDYLRSEAGLLLSGGFVTTAHLIGNSMMLLLDNPVEMKKVRGNHNLIPNMLEESLRLESPVQWQQRIAVVDTQIGGVAVPKDSVVVVMLAAGNRDPSHYANPGTFDIDRPNVARHLAFGHGVHFCLGAPLGRLEAKIAYERLFTRLDRIELAPGRNDFSHLDSPLFRGLKSLHIVFDKAA